MRFPLSLLALSFLLVACGNDAETLQPALVVQEDAVEAPATGEEPTETESPTVDSALVSKVNELIQLAQKLEALIPMPESACFALGQLDSAVSSLRLLRNPSAESEEASQYFQRLESERTPNSMYDCAGISLKYEIEWREKYIPAVYNYLALAKEGAERGFLTRKPLERDPVMLESKLYVIYLRWVQVLESAKDVTMFGTKVSEESAGRFQYKLVASLYQLEEEIQARELELGERGLDSQVRGVRNVIAKFSSSAAKGADGFEQTERQLKELVIALKALSDVSLNK